MLCVLKRAQVGVRGAAEGQPRRRRGGGRAELGGGVWHGEKRYTARGMWVQGSRGDAWGGGEAGVGLWPAQSGGRAVYGTGGGKQRSRQEEEEKDWFANSENFRYPDVNQR